MIITVITNYNKASYIADAIQSALAQGDPVIVVDDASTDGSREIIQRFGSVEIHCLDVNVGATMATVVGIEAAINQGAEFVTLLDGDDALCSNANAYYRKTLERFPCGGIYSSTSRHRNIDRRKEAVPCDLESEVLIIYRALARWLKHGKGTTAVCARPELMLADIIRDLRYQDHQIAYSVHKNANRVIYSDAVTHYCSPVGRDNLSSHKFTKYRSMMRLYCHIYSDIEHFDETRLFAKRMRRYVWKAAFYRCVKLDFRFFTQFLRVLFGRNPTPDDIEFEAGIAIERLGYSKQ